MRIGWDTGKRAIYEWRIIRLLPKQRGIKQALVYCYWKGFVAGRRGDLCTKYSQRMIPSEQKQEAIADGLATNWGLPIGQVNFKKERNNR
jgi:hypothetical protein